MVVRLATEKLCPKIESETLIHEMIEAIRVQGSLHNYVVPSYVAMMHRGTLHAVHARLYWRYYQLASALF